MQESSYSISEYIKDVRQIVSSQDDQQAITDAIKPLSLRLAASKDLQDPKFRECDEDQGFGVHLLHEEDNHDLGIFVFSWMPNSGTPPHNHQTWAVVAVVEGEEQEVFWERKDDGSKSGYAKLEKSGEDTMKVGDVSTCMPLDIHSVWNNGATPSVSLHTYGRHINFTGRSMFNPDKDQEIPYVVTVEE